VRILVTGATGFVGRALVARMLADGEHQIRCAIRSASTAVAGSETAIIGDIDGRTDWSAALRGVDCVVHLAARVHDLKVRGRAALESYRAVNTAGTISLARQATDANVARFVFLSSVKVNGEAGSFTEADPPAPADSYGISKHEAELELLGIARDSSMDIVTVRPPLVYGPGVKANFLALVQAVSRGVPLPFGAVHNKRSFVAVDNLIDFLVICVHHSGAANETFFVSDGEDLSTPELLRRVAAALGTKSRVLPVPPAILTALATIVGQRAAMQRLLGTLRVDISKARTRLNWSPPLSVDEGLRRFAAAAQ
jgi:nucleoside-diphosphate-sugar epimerase